MIPIVRTKTKDLMEEVQRATSLSDNLAFDGFTGKKLLFSALFFLGHCAWFPLMLDLQLH